MKLVRCLLIALFALASIAAFAQDEVNEPTIYPGQLPVINSHPQRTSNLNAAKTSLQTSSTDTVTPKLQTFPYQFVSPRDGHTYAGTVVGGNPFNRGARPVNIPVVLIPLRVQFTGTVRNFDPTSPDDGCLGAGNTAVSLSQASPIFQPANFTINGVNVGNTTFIDAFQRAEFWPSVSSVSPSYHLGLNVTVAPKQTISVVNGGGSGSTFSFSGSCTTNTTAVDNPPRLGIVDINFIDPLLQQIITNLGLNPSQFPLFVIYGVVISDGDPSNLNNCCILGYHNDEAAAPDPLHPTQTYGIASYDQGYLFSGTNDVSVMSHEVLEWANDPSGVNPTPPWGGIGQVGGCQDNLEVGDPLSGTLMPPVLMPNGKTYHLQENAFFSWFYGVPYAGAGGKYSSNGTFGGFAKNCPPGGTN